MSGANLISADVECTGIDMPRDDRHGRMGYRFKFTKCVWDAPGPAISMAFATPHSVTNLPSTCEYKILQTMRNAIDQQSEKGPFFVVMDLTNFPIVRSCIDASDTEDAGDQFSKDLVAAHEKMKTWKLGDETDELGGFKGLHYILVNTRPPFTGLKVVQ